MISDLYCISCGEYCGEGEWLCPICKAKSKQNYKRNISRNKKKNKRNKSKEYFE